MKKQKRYSNGGQMAAQLAGLIPGVGSIVSPVISTFDQIRDQSIQDEMMYQQNLLMQQNNQRMLQPFPDGGMLKRADGSYSKRGLWDNIRANSGSGKTNSTNVETGKED